MRLRHRRHRCLRSRPLKPTCSRHRADCHDGGQFIVRRSASRKRSKATGSRPDRVCASIPSMAARRSMIRRSIAQARRARPVPPPLRHDHSNGFEPTHERHRRRHRPRDPRFPRQPHGRSRRRARVRRRPAARPCRRARRPARRKRSSCATATPRATSARACCKAVENVNTEICEAILGLDASEQASIDQTLIELDGTENKGRLGANAILAVSLRRGQGRGRGIVAAAVSLSRRRRAQMQLPVPMMNVINGGAHANNKIDLQEFMIVPVGAPTFREALRYGAEVFHTLKKLIDDARHADDRRRRRRLRAEPAEQRGGAAAVLRGDRQGRLHAGHRHRARARLRGDASSTRTARYNLDGGEARAHRRSSSPTCSPTWCDKYPIISIEDGMAEDDWDGWKLLTERLGQNVQLVGDDLFVTNTKILKQGIDEGRRQLDPDQDQPDRHAVRDVRRDRRWPSARGYTAVISHRSGETEDTHHRRHRRRHQRRPDQDRLAVALRPHREVQPAAAHRGRPGRRGELSGPRRVLQHPAAAGQKLTPADR